MTEHTIAVSGGFDPLHAGHIAMIRAAAKFGKVWVILNSDAWLIRKKGYRLMPFDARRDVLLALKDVEGVISVDDDDGTVCAAFNTWRPTFFANGGDRQKDNTPELDVCAAKGIHPLFGIGGDSKMWASSHLVHDAALIMLSNWAIRSIKGPVDIAGLSFDEALWAISDPARRNK